MDANTDPQRGGGPQRRGRPVRLWLGRYLDVTPQRLGPVFHRFWAVDDRARTGDAPEQCARRLLLVPAPGLDPGVAATRLDRAVNALGQLRHADVPEVAERGRAGDVEFLALRCDAIDDVAQLSRRAATAGRRLSLQATSGLAERYLSLLEAAHGLVDPSTGRPLCLGAHTWANVLLSRSGKPWFLGFGDDLLAAHPDPAGELTVAPEVALGADPTPGGDLWAVLALFRSLLPMRELPPEVVRVLQGTPTADDDVLRTTLTTIHARILASPDKRTQSAREVHDAYRHVWRLTGVTPSLRAFADALFGDQQTAGPPQDLLPDLTVGPEARWLRVNGDAFIDLERRHAARRMVWALVVAAMRAERLGVARRAELSAADLLSCGWPGERMLLDAGIHRVHVAIAQLRRMGLGAVLQRGETGYRLAVRTLVVASGGA